MFQTPKAVQQAYAGAENCHSSKELKLFLWPINLLLVIIESVHIESRAGQVAVEGGREG